MAVDGAVVEGGLVIEKVTAPWKLVKVVPVVR